MTDFLEIIRKRRSIRKYKDKKVEKEKLERIIKSAMFCPSARNTKAWEFVLVTDKEKIEKLGGMKPHSLFAKKSQAIIVLCSQEWDYWVEDCGIVIESIYLETVNQGLGTCCIQIRDARTFTEGENAEDFVRKILNIPSEIRVLCMFSLGYSDENLSLHSDNEYLEEKVHWEKW